jgi:hypothetical protein
LAPSRPADPVTAAREILAMGASCTPQRRPELWDG